MSRLRFPVAALIVAVAPIAVVAGAGVARADPPAPGDPCAVLHSTTRDVNGRTMWCNATMTGTHTLVWQYGGPS